MRIAIVGYPSSGKSTVFSALSGKPGATSESAVAAVEVPDQRIFQLSALYRPKKTTYATVEFLDLGAGDGIRKESQELGTHFLSMVRPSQVLVHVIDGFSVPEMAQQEILDGVSNIDTEFALADLAQCENRLQRMEKTKILPGPMQEEHGLLKKAYAWLEQGKPLRLLPELGQAESLRSFAFLSAKPMITVLNTSEESLFYSEDQLPKKVLESRVGKTGCFVPFCAQLESEIASLSSIEAREFLKDYNIASPARERVIQAGYGLMGLMAFFTVGEDEVRAWTIRQGTLAKEAAGAIHSDISRGFIRAEVCDFDTVMEFSGFDQARKAGKVRLEGKDYPVQAGDIISFRYNV